MTTATLETRRPGVKTDVPAAQSADRMRRVARRWRYLTNAGAALVSVVLLLWTLTPIYNIIIVSLEAEGDVPKALEEYRVLATSYPGAEAAVRYAQLLQAQGERGEAQRVVHELLEQARIAPGHYRRAQRTWLEAAQRLLQS